MPAADVVAFLDLDQELLAPRYRAAEQAMALLARAARLTGGRAGGGRLLVQTRLPRHEVLDAVLHADPGRLAAAERPRREMLRFPPAAVLASVSGAGGPGLRRRARPPAGRRGARARPTVAGCCGRPTTPSSATPWPPRPGPPGRLRVEVDPLRV